MMSKTDRVLYSLHKSKMLHIQDPTPIPGLSPKQVAAKTNFLIVCGYGDWSGYRTLQECIDQFPELEGYGREDGYFIVVERF